MKIRHVAGEPLAEHDLLLVAAAQQPHRLRRASPSRAARRRSAPPAPPRSGAAARRSGASRRPCGSAMLRATVRPATSPCALRSSGSRPMPRAIASAGLRKRTSPAVDEQPPVVEPIGAGDHARELGAAGAEQPGDAEHFAGVQREADVGQHAARRLSSSTRSSSAPRSARTFGKCSLRSRFAISRTSSGTRHLDRSAASSHGGRRAAP